MRFLYYSSSPKLKYTAQTNPLFHRHSQQLESCYRVRLRERSSGVAAKGRRSRQRYLRLSRSRSGGPGSGACRRGSEDCLTEDEYHLRLFYSAYRRLLRVHHVLGYAVRLSWLALEDHAASWP